MDELTPLPGQTQTVDQNPTPSSASPMPPVLPQKSNRKIWIGVAGACVVVLLVSIFVMGKTSQFTGSVGNIADKCNGISQELCLKHQDVCDWHDVEKICTPNVAPPQGEDVGGSPDECAAIEKPALCSEDPKCSWGDDGKCALKATDNGLLSQEQRIALEKLKAACDKIPGSNFVANGAVGSCTVKGKTVDSEEKLIELIRELDLSGDKDIKEMQAAQVAMQELKTACVDKGQFAEGPPPTCTLKDGKVAESAAKLAELIAGAAGVQNPPSKFEERCTELNGNLNADKTVCTVGEKQASTIDDLKLIAVGAGSGGGEDLVAAAKAARDAEAFKQACRAGGGNSADGKACTLPDGRTASGSDELTQLLSKVKAEAVAGAQPRNPPQGNCPDGQIEYSSSGQPPKACYLPEVLCSQIKDAAFTQLKSGFIKPEDVTQALIDAKNAATGCGFRSIDLLETYRAYTRCQAQDQNKFEWDDNAKVCNEKAPVRDPFRGNCNEGEISYIFPGDEEQEAACYPKEALCSLIKSNIYSQLKSGEITPANVTGGFVDSQNAGTGCGFTPETLTETFKAYEACKANDQQQWDDNEKICKAKAALGEFGALCVNVGGTPTAEGQEQKCTLADGTLLLTIAAINDYEDGQKQEAAAAENARLAADLQKFRDGCGGARGAFRDRGADQPPLCTFEDGSSVESLADLTSKIAALNANGGGNGGNDPVVADLNAQILNLREQLAGTRNDARITELIREIARLQNVINELNGLPHHDQTNVAVNTTGQGNGAGGGGGGVPPAQTPKIECADASFTYDAVKKVCVPPTQIIVPTSATKKGAKKSTKASEVAVASTDDQGDSVDWSEFMDDGEISIDTGASAAGERGSSAGVSGGSSTGGAYAASGGAGGLNAASAGAAAQGGANGASASAGSVNAAGSRGAYLQGTTNIQGKTGPGMLLYPLLVGAANGAFYLFRRKRRK